MVAELNLQRLTVDGRCSLAKISMVAEQTERLYPSVCRCSLAKISMVAER